VTDRRPERVYGILVRDGRAFLVRRGDRLGLPGGVFRPLAEDRKVELRAHLMDQLGVDATRIWAQGAFEYQDPAESEPAFAGFYSVWEWNGELPDSAGEWLDLDGLAGAALAPSLRILLMSVLNTLALRTR
jgi:hypothetical protein